MLREKDRKFGGRDPLVKILPAAQVGHYSAKCTAPTRNFFLLEGHSDSLVISGNVCCFTTVMRTKERHPYQVINYC